MNVFVPCNKKNIILHFPWNVDKEIARAGYNRKKNLTKAFEALGFKVDVISGSGKERLKKINHIKNKIHNNIKYDFLYSESSTFPTMFTEGIKESVEFPFLDFKFFNFCKKNNIPIGLFYRDIYWKFSLINVDRIYKKPVILLSYLFDLLIYKRYISVLYLPTLHMSKYLPFNFSKIRSLPPGSNDHKPRNRNKKEKMNIFYLGGVNKLYNIHKLIKVIGDFKDITLTICCRKEEWEKNKHRYSSLLRPNIRIVHLSGDKLTTLFNEADVASIFIEPHKYRKIAMPQKLFEYISFHKPIICTSGTAVGDFVEKYDIGWSIAYDESSLKNLINSIKDNQDLLVDKQKNISKIIDRNTWVARANQVVSDLGGMS